jgi:hypothetical protein
MKNTPTTFQTCLPVDRVDEDDCFLETRVVIEQGRLCQQAKYAYDSKQVFRIQLDADRLLDASDDSVRPDNPEVAPVVSLLDLLKRGVFKDRYRFFPNDKRILAYTLGHALLNLYESDWLQKLWTLENVFLPFAKETDMVYNIHQPYVACALSADRPPLDTLDTLHRYPPILAFAKLLWEIETGEQLQATRTHKTGKLSLWYTLKDRCDNFAKDQLTCGYRNALEACLNFPTYLMRERKQNREATVQHVILKYIVQELENEVELSDRSKWGKRALSLSSDSLITFGGEETEVDPGPTRSSSLARSHATSAPRSEQRGRDLQLGLAS